MSKWSLRVLLALILGVFGALVFTRSVQAASNCDWNGNGGSDTNWSTAANWHCTGGATYPSASNDSATINLATSTIVTVDTSVTIGSLTLNQGTLTGTGDLNTGTFTWTGGTLSGTGQTNVSSQLSLSNTLVANRTTSLAATAAATWSGGNGSISGSGALSIGGTFTRSGSGTLTISGITLTGAGTLTFSSAITTFSTNATYNISGTTTVNGGTLDLSASTITINNLGGTLNISSGTLNLGTSSGSIATLNWSGGTLSGAGTSTITTNLVFSGNPTLNARSLVNAGTATWTASGTLTVIGSPTFINEIGGTLVKSGSGTANMNGAAFTNAGSVSVTGGTLSLGLAATASTGPYSTSAGAGLTLSGVHTFSTGATIGGLGTVTFNSGTFTLNDLYSTSGTTILNGTTVVTISQLPNTSTGTFTVNAGRLVFADSGTSIFDTGANFSGAGSVEFQAGTVTFQGGYSMSSGGRTIVSGATLNLSGAASVGLGDTLEESAGTLNLGTVNTSIANLTWSGGEMAGSGTTTVTGTLSLSGTTMTLTGRALTLSASGAGSWTVAGTLSGSAGAAFNIAGTLTKSGAGIAMTQSVKFNNTGTVSVSGGTLDLSLPSTPNSTGAYSVADGSTLGFTGPHTFNGNITGTGSGTVIFNSGALAVAGTYNVTGTTTIAGADVNFSGGTITNPGATLNLNSGSLTLGTASSSVGTFNWSGGTLQGTGTTTVTSSLVFSGNLSLANRTLVNSGSAGWTAAGGLAGTGTAAFINGSTGTLNKSGSGAVTFTGSIFSNAGTVSVTGGTLDLSLSSSASSSGPYQVSTGASLRFAGPHTFASGSTISGQGTAEFYAGAFAINNNYVLEGTTTISNSGTVVAITIPSTATISGPFVVNNGKLTFAITTGTLTFSAGGFSGSGTVEFTSGAINVNSPYGMSGNTSVSGATLDLAGAAISSLGSLLTVSGGQLNLAGNSSIPALTWSGGTISGSPSASLTVSTNLTLGGALTLTGLTLSNSGIATWSADGSLSGTGTFSNANQFNKSGAGTSTSVSTSGFANGGLIHVASGTLALTMHASPASTGTYTADSGATLSLSGDHNFTSSSRISGLGTVEFTTGAVVVAGKYEVTGTTTISGATVDLSGATLAIAGSAINLSAGSINLGTRTASISSLTLSGGGLTGSGTLTTGALTWSGGTMSGSGTTSVSISWNISGNPVLTDRTLINAGSASWASGGSVTGTGILDNTGTLTKSGSGTTSTISGITFKNDTGGSVKVDSGTLAIGLPATFSSIGTYTTAQGAALSFNGGHTFGAGATISGAGTFIFLSGSITINSTYNLDTLNGATQINGADVDLTPASLTSLGANLVLSSGSLKLGPANPSLSSMEWSGGAISGGGKLTVNGSLSMGGALNLVGLTLENAGAATWNSPGSLSGTGAFVNSGSLEKTIDGTDVIGIATFNNSGAVSASAGTLEISPSGSAGSTGSYVSNGSATILFSGLYNFAPIANISGSGTVEFKSGEVNILCAYNLSGTTTISGATVNFIPPGILTSLGPVVNLSAGTLNLSSGLFIPATPLAITTLTISGGTLAGSDSIAAATFNWSSGALSGSGDTQVSAGGAVNFSGSDPLLLDTRKLVNNGAATWNRSGGSSYLYFSNNPMFINSTGGSFTILQSGSYVFVGSGSFQNDGNIIKSNPEPVGISGISFYNAGSVAVNNGDMVIIFSPSAISTGSYSVLDGATLSFMGSHNFAPSSSISGNGGVIFPAGTMNIGGAYQVGGSTTVNGATVILSKANLSGLGAELNISAGSLDLGAWSSTVTTFNLAGGEFLGTSALTVGTLNWSDGLMSGSGTTTVNSALNFNGVTPIILDQRTLSNHGTADWNNTGYLYLINNAVVLNASGATMNLNSSTSYIIYGSGMLENDGTLNFSKGKIDVTAFRQTATAVLNLSIQGQAPADDFGQITTHTADLNGALNINFSSYTPISGDNFVLMTYTTTPASNFTTVQFNDNLPAKNWNWQLAFQPTQLFLSTRSFLYLPVVNK